MRVHPIDDTPPFRLIGDAAPAEVNGNLKMTAAPYMIDPYSQNSGLGQLSVALIGPDVQRRTEAAQMLAECAGINPRLFTHYPEDFEEQPRSLDQSHDVVVIDLDSDPEFALTLVEKVAMYGNSTVMVYSSKADSALLMRCMRAGAREFLTVPFEQATVLEALTRAAQRRPIALEQAREAGKLLVFMGAKGGVGVTSVATNFAVALAQDASKKTLLIDLDLPLGDAALNLGIRSEFSTVNALMASERLDGAFLRQLAAEHSSGLMVLGAPGKFPHYEPGNDAINKLVDVARQEFDNVVVDIGSRRNVQETTLFSHATTIYLVTQTGIPELRNSHRLISQVFSGETPRLEVVLNRFESRTLGVSEEHIAKALTRPPQWKVPNDHALVRKMQVDGSPLVLGESNLARMIRQMADSVHGQQGAQQPKKKGFRLFGRSNSAEKPE